VGKETHPPKPDADVFAQLVFAEEVAEILGGVSRQRLNQIAAKPDAPQPVKTGSTGRIWWGPDWTAYAASRPRRAGRPKGQPAAREAQD
jgi:hypothetical protein